MIVYLVGLVLSYNCVFVIISWVQEIISCVFRGSQIFSRGFLLGPNFFVAGISWVQNIYSLVFCRLQFFSHGYLLGLKLFSVGISWFENIFSLVGNYSTTSVVDHITKSGTEIYLKVHVL